MQKKISNSNKSELLLKKRKNLAKSIFVNCLATLKKIAATSRLRLAFWADLELWYPMICAIHLIEGYHLVRGTRSLNTMNTTHPNSCSMFL